MQTAKKGLRYIAVFLLTLAVLLGTLIGAAVIPRSAIQDSVLKSAEYLCEKEQFRMLAEDVEGSRIDRYADSILLAIAYQYDAEHPLRSVMESAYYFTPYQNENVNLLDAVTNAHEPNQQYLRYWHGSNVIVRPLLIFFELREIYVINGILLAVLILLLFAALIRSRAYLPAMGIAAGLLLTAVWFVPFSLEYTWTYLLTMVLSLIGWHLAERGRREALGAFFLIGGMLTSFVDFLTTETLTLLIPVLLILWHNRNRRPEESFAEAVRTAGRAAGFWGAGYAGMWISKWVMAAVVLREDVQPYVAGHIAERLGGVGEAGMIRYLMGAIGRNLSCLFPFEYGTAGVLAGSAMLLYVFYRGYVYHRKNPAWSWILLYALIGLVPYVRYLVLHNHSYLHFFFTYRAQMATVLAAIMGLGELTERE